MNQNHRFKKKHSDLISEITVCAYCGIEGNNLHLDHIYPRSKGGQTTLENTTMCCIKCNSTKSTDDINQFRERALSRMKYHIEEYNYYKHIVGSIEEGNYSLSNILQNG